MTLQGRYTILGEIASGGTATVFLAEDRVLRRKVALKKLHPHLLNHPEMVKRFEKEAVAVASLSHVNVIKIFDFGREDKSIFLAMEYVDGASLDAGLRAGEGVVPNLAALTLFHQLMEGLGAAHALGICHRDIKPSNVLIDRKGCVRLADFGIAFLSEETSITRTGAYLGTPGYSAPEQADGKPITEKTDIFAAGTLLYRCLTGRMPFVADSPHAVLKSIVEKTQAKANLVNPRILPGLADLAQEMLAKAPHDRPDAATCVRRLEEIAKGLGFPLDPNRLCRLFSDPAAAAEKEGRELAERLARQARLVNKLGKSREAMKLFALAEVFAGKDSDLGREAGRFARTGLLKVRREAAIASACLVLLALAAWMLRGHFSPAGDGSPSTASVPEIAAPIPQAGLVALALPSEIPDWDQSHLGRESAADPDLSPEIGAHRATTPSSAVSAASASEFAAKAASGPGQNMPRGFFWVKTNPPFARVLVDGKDVGRTPMAVPISLPEGPHNLEVQREGCRPVTQVFHVSEWDTVFLRLTLDRQEDSP